MQQTVADPGFYAQEQAIVQETLKELADAETLLDERIERWSELEALQDSLR